MAVGSLLTLALLPPSKVVRSDGAHVSLHKFSNWGREAVEVFKLFLDWHMLILIPLFAGSNWFYTYQYNIFNGPHFMSIRARALNNILYWIFQIIGAGFFGWFLDLEILGSRKRRAFAGCSVTLVVILALWIGAFVIQGRFTRESVQAADYVAIDVFDKEYPGLVVEYALFGLIDAVYQGFCYWLMGTMTNDTERAARYGGFYKAIQNAGAAIANQLEANSISYMSQLIAVFVFNVVGLLLAYVVCYNVPEVTVEVVDNLADGHKEAVLVAGRVDPVEDVKEFSASKEKIEKAV
ncbi:hypothetical protein G6F56_005959 [Rhizopus delemar]|nr:hypothetical protein G6F56_005959 [Rhizopus delemar]